MQIERFYCVSRRTYSVNAFFILLIYLIVAYPLNESKPQFQATFKNWRWEVAKQLLNFLAVFESEPFVTWLLFLKKRLHWSAMFNVNIEYLTHCFNSFIVNYEHAFPVEKKKILKVVWMEFHEIRCFRHCSTLKNVYCLVIPESCNICGAHLKSCAYLLPPFCVPSPFSFHLSTLVDSPQVSSFQPLKPHSLVVKPTKGDFLR